MRGTRGPIFGGLIGALLIVGALPAAGAQGIPAQVVDYDPPQSIEKFSYIDFGKTGSPKDDTTGKAKFRVVERTGNCCENYLITDKKGRLYDIGGSYINFTANDGKTWKQVKPINPLVNGEGTMSMAPNGDVIGVEWDPYSGDHLLSYKFDAQKKTWEYLEMPLHTPFYDRPWLTVVPGPFTVGGVEVPYVVFIDGAPHGGPFLFSSDGLTYTEAKNPALEERLNPAYNDWPRTSKDKALDWTVPNTNSPIVAIGGGYALASPGPLRAGWSIMNPETLTWSAVVLPDGGRLPTTFNVDSKGHLHTVLPAGEAITYQVSTNKGKTWRSLSIPLPKGITAAGAQTDMRVNADLGVAAVAMHITTQDGDKDYVFTVDISDPKKLRAIRRYEIGLGDINASSGVGQEIRFDFETVVLFPDGRIGVSFLDSTTGPVFHLQEPIRQRLGPALAIEL